MKITSIYDRSNAVDVGEFTLHPCVGYPDGSRAVWIENSEGEGGQFPALALEKLIRKFYDKNF